MVSYLILMVGLTIIVTGIFFSFISDGVDSILGAINGYANTPLQGAMDSDSITTGNELIMIFKLSLMPSLIVLVYWALNMSTKPIKPY